MKKQTKNSHAVALGKLKKGVKEKPSASKNAHLEKMRKRMMEEREFNRVLSDASLGQEEYKPEK